MKIIAKNLIENGVEVDMPVWDKDNMGKPLTPKTIAWDKDRKQFVLKVIKTGEIDYAYDKLSDLVRTTNRIYDYDDEAIED